MISVRWLVACCLLIVAGSIFAQDEVRIGILSYRSKPQTQAQWTPLEAALNKAIPEHDFKIVAYGLDEMSEAVDSRQVDFILTNPGHYVLMAHRSGLSAPLATLSNLEQEKPVSSFGGVIFTRADKLEINTLKDVRGKTVAASSMDSLGSYEMQAFELIHAGIRMPQDIELKLTGFPQDEVVNAVLANRADVGFVRSGLLESLVAEGKLNMSGIKILNRQDLSYFPTQVSTPLYPEWPFASLPQTNRDLKRKVASYLLTVEENKPLAKSLSIHGFDVPADYESVENILRELRMPPFDITPSFTVVDVWNRYRWPIASGMGAIGLILLLGFNLLLAIRRLVSEKSLVQTQSVLLQNSNQRFEAVLRAVPDLMFELDSKGRYLNVWGIRGDLLAAPENQLLGRTVEEMLPEHAAQVVKASIAEAAEKSSSFGHEFKLELPYGLCWFELSVSKRQTDSSQSPSFIVLSRDITSRKEAEEKIELLAYYDPLTHLPNRRLLLDRLQQELASNVRSGKLGALLFIDLDNFKTLNDTLGHDVGDFLLQKVAERLTTCVREGDTVSRLGGDEFVIMLNDLSEVELEAAAQTEIITHKILSALNRPYQLDSRSYHNTPSIGATLFGKHKTAIEEILKQADIAMYQAKNAGRNTVRFFDVNMQVAINNRVELEDALRSAVDLKQFVLYFQIQVDNFERPIGAEALIRWMNPEIGLVSPLKFIPLAEETGLILPIGQWVLETACAQLKSWQSNALTQHLTLSVNVSAKQFHEANFVSQVQSAVSRYEINPALLKLEPTESILLENIKEAVATMTTLKATGVHFALDDFGTGFSSLQYLKILPLNQLKIDQSFVKDLVSDLNDQAIVRTIIAMAKSLNLNVIAEGVETEEQQQILQRNGCNCYQGYFFGKPMPIEEFDEQLKRH